METPQDSDSSTLERRCIMYPRTHERSRHSRITEECISLFKLLLKKISHHDEVNAETYRHYKKSCSSFMLWERSYSVIDGELDGLLARSKRVHVSSLEPLLNIGRILSMKTKPFLGHGESLDMHHMSLTSLLNMAENEISTNEYSRDYDAVPCTSDSDSDESGTTDHDKWTDAARYLWVEVRRLHALEALLEMPGSNVPPFAPEPHTMYFSERIRNRFPNSDAWFVDRLARSNWNRFLELLASREKHEQTRETTGHPDDTRDTAAPSELASKFHDSGLGTTLDNKSYADTIMSYRRGDQEAVTIPPLPEEARMRKAFDCVACGEELTIKTTHDWKNHLYQDLKPWICHELRCVSASDGFPTRKAWTEHLATVHMFSPKWLSFRCPLCKEDTGSGQSVISKHLLAHMEEISFALLLTAAQSDVEEVSEHNLSTEKAKAHSSKTETITSLYLPDVIVANGATFPTESSALEDDSLKCPLLNCNYYTTGKKTHHWQYLMKHMQTHAKKQYTCLNCGKKFSRKDNLKVHMRIRCHPVTGTGGVK